ncbi:MAG: apolipoprotein A1/A4/E family protein [Cyclobacteriaceae bacterium]|nr:apolipoprotein A1/A4/E family protein [Cyclobacteriaceae bacterium]
MFTVIEDPAFAQEKPKTAVDQAAAQRRLDSLATLNKRKADSLKNLANKPQEKANAVVQDANRFVTKPADSIQNKLNNAAQSIQSKTTDQVQQRIGNLGEKISSPADSLQQKLNGTSQSLQNKTITPLQQSAEGIAQKLANPADSLQQKLNTTIGSAQGSIRAPMDSLQQMLNFSDPATAVDLNIPGTNLNIPGTSPAIPGTTTAIPSAASPNLRLSGIENTGTNLPATSLPGTSLPATAVPDLNLQQGIAVPKVDELPGVKDINQVNGQVDQVGGQLKKAGDVQGDLGNIKQGNLEEVKTLPKLAEDEALKAAELNKLKADADRFHMQHDQYKALIEKYKDKKRMQEELEKKAAAVANELVAKNVSAIQDAQQQLSKAKRMYGNVQSVKNLPSKRPNEMKDKPFRERIVPGVNLQIYQSTHLLIDLAPTVGYRFTGRWTAGLAYTFRIGVDKNFDNYIRNEQVYGPRIFAQFLAFKGFFLHGDLEALHAPAVGTPEESASTVIGSYLGIGKNFNVNRRVKGQITGLYRAEFQGALPAQNTFNLRIGFSYNMRKIQRVPK